jgi:hypothetical protein
MQVEAGCRDRTEENKVSSATIFVSFRAVGSTEPEALACHVAKLLRGFLLFMLFAHPVSPVAPKPRRRRVRGVKKARAWRGRRTRHARRVCSPDEDILSASRRTVASPSWRWALWIIGETPMPRTRRGSALPEHKDPCHPRNLSRRSLDVGGSAVKISAVLSETFLDRDTSDFIVGFDIEINRGDLRQLAPRKKLLKSSVSSSEPLRAFRFLT